VGLDLGADDYLVKPFSPGEPAAPGEVGLATQQRAPRCSTANIRLSVPVPRARWKSRSAGRNLETRDDHCITVRGSVALACEPLILS